MGKLVLGGVLLLISFFMMIARSGASAPRASGLLRLFALAFTTLAVLLVLAALVVVIEPGQVGVKQLMPGIHLVAPWSSIERYSTREEQFPRSGEQVETIAALSSEQMGMTVDAGLRWQINPMDAARIFIEIGLEEQIHSIVFNAIRKGVRDGMVRRPDHPAALRRAAVPDRGGHGVLPARPAAARAGSSGDQ
jgi:regulator of protease activity HflC (stomatin/prohibitin superfamily)